MSRPLDNATKAAFDKPLIPLAVILYLDVENDPLFAWSGIGDLTFAGARARTNMLGNSAGGLSGAAAGGVNVASSDLPTRYTGASIRKHTRDNAVGDNNVGSIGSPVLTVGQAYVYAVDIYLPKNQVFTSIVWTNETDTRQVNLGLRDQWQRVYLPFVAAVVSRPMVLRVTAPTGSYFYSTAPMAEPGLVGTKYINTTTGAVTVNETGETGDPSLDGKTFKGTGDIIEVSAVSEGVGGSDALEIALPGVNLDMPMMRQLVRDRQRWQFRRAIVWVVLLDEFTDEIVGKPFRIKTGRMDRMPYSEANGPGIIKCSIEGQQAYGNTPLNTRYSEQVDINANDNSQSWAHSLANMTAELGKSTGGSTSVNSALARKLGDGFVGKVGRAVMS